MMIDNRKFSYISLLIFFFFLFSKQRIGKIISNNKIWKSAIMQTTRSPLLFPLFFFNLSFVSWFTSEGKISKNLGNDRNAEYHFSHAFFVTFTRFHHRPRNNRQDLIIGQFHLNLERVEEFESLRWCARANPRGLIRSEGKDWKFFAYLSPHGEGRGTNSKERNVVIFRLNAHRNFGRARIVVVWSFFFFSFFLSNELWNSLRDSWNFILE